MAVHKGDVGTVFRCTIVDEDGDVVPLAGASSKQIVFRKPNGVVVAKPAVFVTDGSDGKVQYTSLAGDLDVKGDWELQGTVALDSGTWSSDVLRFEVKPNLQ